MLGKREFSALFMPFNVREDLRARLAARSKPSGVPTEPRKPGARSLESQKQALQASQMTPTLIRREEKAELIRPAAPERAEIPKTYAPPSPRFFRSERPRIMSQSERDQMDVRKQAESFFLTPQQVVARKVDALAAHFNGK